MSLSLGASLRRLLTIRSRHLMASCLTGGVEMDRLVEGIVCEDRALLRSVVALLAARSQVERSNHSLELYLILTTLDKHLAGGVEAAMFVDMDLNISNQDDGDTALHHAARASHVRVMEVLLTAGGGVDINKQNKRGFTPLHSAVHFNSQAVVRLLVKRGADTTTIHDKCGNLPLHHAASPEIKKILSVAMAWWRRKNYLMFLSHFSFIECSGQGTPAEHTTAAQAEYSCFLDDSSLGSNAVHRVFNIADLDRFICSFL